MTLYEKAKDLISQLELQTKCRKRRFVNQRSYLVFFLRRHGASYPYIAELLKQNHATCIHAYNNAKYWERKNDKFYFLDTEFLRNELNNFEIRISQNDLFVDVINCGSIKELEAIQERIKRNEYKNENEQILN
jgi:hypothetical protein